MPKYFKAPRGTFDFLPQDNDFFNFLKKVIRHRLRQAGFRRISPPVFEELGTFQRSLGENSEILEKELYSFLDRQGRAFALRPEITTGVIRSFIEHKTYEGPLPAEFYYIERCFRFERLRPGKSRQFWQFGSEVVGETDPSIDAQIIYLSHRILSDLNIRDVCTLRISTMGTHDDRNKFLEALADFYSGKERSLTPESREKLKQKKYLELLSTKSEDEAILLQMAPKMIDFLSPDSRAFFETMLSYLDAFGIAYEVDYSLTRSLNYYTQTIFEFHEKGTNNKILVGGRYDGLVDTMGGPDLGGAGFSAGVERVIDLMKKQGIDVPHKDNLQVFLAATGPVAKKHALPILVKLREHGFHAVGVLGKTSISEQLKRAGEFGVPYTLLMGDIEVKKKQIIVRNMKTGKQEWIDDDKILEKMDALLVAPSTLDTTTDFLGHE